MTSQGCGQIWESPTASCVCVCRLHREWGMPSYIIHSRPLRCAKLSRVDLKAELVGAGESHAAFSNLNKIVWNELYKGFKPYFTHTLGDFGFRQGTYFLGKPNPLQGGLPLTAIV